MAGDWIKIEHSLPHKPEVMQLASMLGIDEMAVVGHLVLFWSWCDQNLSPDCPATIGTTSGLDRVVGRAGFATAMEKVGWLNFLDGKIEIPNYDHHLSESAKKRALEQRKKRRQRESNTMLAKAQSPKLSPSCPATIGTKTALENRDRDRDINTAAAKAAANEKLLFEKLELTEACATASKLAKASKLKDRELHWQVACIALAIQPRMIGSMIRKMERKELDDPGQYMFVAVKNEVTAQGLNWLTVKSLIPPCPPVQEPSAKESA